MRRPKIGAPTWPTMTCAEFVESEKRRAAGVKISDQAEHVAKQLRATAAALIEAAATVERVIEDSGRSESRDGREYAAAVHLLGCNGIRCTQSAHLSWGD